MIKRTDGYLHLSDMRIKEQVQLTVFFFLDRPGNINCRRWIKKNKKESFVHAKRPTNALTRVAVEFRIVVRHAGSVKYTYKMQLIYRITLTLRIRGYSSLQAEVSSPPFVPAGG